MVFLAWVGFVSGLSGCQLVSSDGYGAQCDFTGFYRVLPTTIGLIPSTIIYWVSLYWMVRPLAPHLFRSRSLRCGLGFTGFNRGRAGFIGVVFLASFLSTPTRCHRRWLTRRPIGDVENDFASDLCGSAFGLTPGWVSDSTECPSFYCFFLNQVSYSVKL